MAGKHFCVSFAEPRDADWCVANGQSVMWDNGAYTFFKLGAIRSADHAKRFYEWVEPKLAPPHWAVIPDVIDGPEEQQRELMKSWPFGLFLGAPVWHMGLSMDYLLELSDEWPRLCFGSSGKYWVIGSQAWERRCDEAFNALSKRHGSLPWIHMLRGLALAGDRWPFASADSVNVARNFKDSNTCPERMARRIDAVQCPIRWELRRTRGGQSSLFPEVSDAR